MTGNFPPGTTAADIDDHFGGEEVEVFGDVTVSASAKALSEDSNDRKEELLFKAVQNGDVEDLLEINIVGEERL